MISTPIHSSDKTRSRGGANNLRHGLLAGVLPKGCKHIENRTLAFRRQLEACVLDVKGGVDLIDAATIQTAVRWERHAMLCQRWLRKEGDQLTANDKLSFSRDVARASAERDKCLRSLGIEKQSSDLWPSFPALPEHTVAQEATGGTTNNKPDTSHTDAATAATRGECSSLMGNLSE